MSKLNNNKLGGVKSFFSNFFRKIKGENGSYAVANDQAVKQDQAVEQDQATKQDQAINNNMAVKVENEKTQENSDFDEAVSVMKNEMSSENGIYESILEAEDKEEDIEGKYNLDALMGGTEGVYVSDENTEEDEGEKQEPLPPEILKELRKRKGVEK